VILGTDPLVEQIADGQAKVEGDDQALIGLLDDSEFWFNIVTP